MLCVTGKNVSSTANTIGIWEQKSTVRNSPKYSLLEPMSIIKNDNNKICQHPLYKSVANIGFICTGLDVKCENEYPTGGRDISIMNLLVEKYKFYTNYQYTPIPQNPDPKVETMMKGVRTINIYLVFFCFCKGSTSLLVFDVTLT